MKDFKSQNKFGNRAERRAGGGGSFVKKDFGGRQNFGGNGNFNRGGERDSGRDTEMFEATCASCGKVCEVPFKPNGKKPVYCKECFAKNGGQAASNDFPKRSFDRLSAPRVQPENNDRKFDDLKRELQMLNTKFDRLISLAESHLSKIEKVSQEVTSTTSEKAPKPKKASSKKAK